MTILLFVGCNPNKKKKWKEPTDILFNFELKQEEKSPSTQKEGSFYIESSSIELSNFTFDGHREQGVQDVSFSQSKIDNLIIEEGISNVISIQKQIPQGTYTDMEYTISQSNITINGKVYTNNKGIVPVKFSHNLTKLLRSKAIDINGNSTIALEMDSPREVNISIDLTSWFNEIPIEKWNASELKEDNSNQQGPPENKIFINPTDNSDLYLNISNKLEENFTVLFK